MAILFDRFTKSLRTGTEDPYTFDHAADANVKLIVVKAAHGTSATDHVVSVTWGGLALERAMLKATDTGGELGGAELWYRGVGLQARANDTITVELASGTTDDILFVAETWTANADVVEFLSGDYDTENQANPQAVLETTGLSAVASSILFSGVNATVSTALLAGMSGEASDEIGGTHVLRADRQTVADTNAFTVGYTIGSDDVASVYANFVEAPYGYPAVVGQSSGFINADVNTHPVVVPAAAAVGDGWLILHAFDGATTITWPDASYVAVSSLEGAMPGGDGTLSARWHVIDGTEGASINVASLAAERSTHQTYLFKAGTFTGSPTGTATTGTDVSPDPPSHTPAAGSAAYEWVIGYAWGPGNLGPTAAPAGYNSLRFIGSGGATGVGVYTLRKTETDTADNPGVFTHAATPNWRSFTISLQGVAAEVADAFQHDAFQDDVFQNPLPIGCLEDEVLADSPTFLLWFSESSGNITDVIGSKVGTANGTPTYGETSPIPGRTAISFDNIADFFSFADHADLDLGDGSWTIELILRRDADNNSQQGIVRKGANAYAIGIAGSGAAEPDNLHLGKQGVAFLAYSAADVPVDATWRHYVITRTGAGAGNTLIYTNAAEGHIDSASIGTTLADTTGALEVGKDDATLGGALAMLAIYKGSILSASHIARHYAAIAVVCETEDTEVDAGHAPVTFAAGAASANVQPNAGHAAVTAAAGAPSVDIKTNAGHAAVAVSAFQPSISVEVNAGHAAVTFAAFTPGTARTAEQAAVTVEAGDVEAAIVTNAGHAAVTVAANQPSASVEVNAGHAAVTFAAFDGTGSPGQSVAAEHAEVTVEAFDPTIDIKTNAGHAAVTVSAGDIDAAIHTNAGHAPVTFAAFDATTSTATFVDVDAEHAAVTFGAFQPSISVQTNAGHAAVSVTANQPSASIAPTAGHAAVSLAAAGAAGSVGGSAGHAAWLTEAFGPAIAIATGAGHAAVTFQAFAGSAEFTPPFPRHAVAAVSVRRGSQGAVSVVHPSGAVAVEAGSRGGVAVLEKPAATVTTSKPTAEVEP